MATSCPAPSTTSNSTLPSPRQPVASSTSSSFTMIGSTSPNTTYTFFSPPTPALSFLPSTLHRSCSPCTGAYLILDINAGTNPSCLSICQSTTAPTVLAGRPLSSAWCEDAYTGSLPFPPTFLVSAFSTASASGSTLLATSSGPVYSRRATSASTQLSGTIPDVEYSILLFHVVWLRRMRPPGAISTRPWTRQGKYEVKSAARAPPSEYPIMVNWCQ